MAKGPFYFSHGIPREVRIPVQLPNDGNRSTYLGWTGMAKVIQATYEQAYAHGREDAEHEHRRTARQKREALERKVRS